MEARGVIAEHVVIEAVVEEAVIRDKITMDKASPDSRTTQSRLPPASIAAVADVDADVVVEEAVADTAGALEERRPNRMVAAADLESLLLPGSSP